jgi:hypothetical protein
MFIESPRQQQAQPLVFSFKLHTAGWYSAYMQDTFQTVIQILTILANVFFDYHRQIL